MIHASRSTKTIPPSKSGQTGTARDHIFLSDKDLERIKDRIRNKHRKDTSRLLVVYGILLLIFVWCVGMVW